MKKQLLKLKYVLLAIFIGLSGCYKEGDPGPKGDQGEQGEPGEQGIQGEKGETGTANVIYSDWFALESANNKYIMTMYHGTTEGIGYTFSASSITQDILDKGNLYIYYKWNDTVYPFPAYVSSTEMRLFNMQLQGFTILLYEKGYDVPPSESIIVEDLELFRYVIVPGGTPANARASQLDYSNYEAVKAYYNIPD